jgi:LEA14-like dessication related protein
MARNLIGIVCLALVLGGCGVNLRQVATRVESVVIDEQTDEGVRVLLTVVAENPNDMALPIVQAKYEVALPGAQTFKFTDLPKATIPANGSQTITLPAALALAGTDATGEIYKVTGSLVYEPPGEVRKLLTEYGVSLPAASFKSTGTLP